jgi:hypothetical protein
LAERRPATLTFNIFQSLEEAADVEQQPRELRADRIERVPHALTRPDHGFGEGRSTTPACAATILRHGRRPVGGDTRQHLGARNIGAQPLAGLQLDRLDQRPSVAPLAAREPCERTFSRVDGNADTPICGLDLIARKTEMLAEKWIDLGAAARKCETCEMGLSRLRDLKSPIGPPDREIGGEQDLGIAGIAGGRCSRRGLPIGRCIACSKLGEQALGRFTDPRCRRCRRCAHARTSLPIAEDWRHTLKADGWIIFTSLARFSFLILGTRSYICT